MKEFGLVLIDFQFISEGSSSISLCSGMILLMNLGFSLLFSFFAPAFYLIFSLLWGISILCCVTAHIFEMIYFMYHQRRRRYPFLSHSALCASDQFTVYYSW